MKGEKNMAKAKVNAYFGVNYVVAIILAIFPVTNLVLGVVYRLKREKFLLLLLNILLFPVFYIVDLVSIILNKDLKYLV